MGIGSIRAGVVVVAALLAVAALAIPAQAKLLRGTPGDDRLVGTERADTMRGRAGDDHLRGRAANDLLVAGRGADTLNGMGGFDRFRGQRGPDVIFARDGVADLINCGSGFDKVYADSVEGGVFDCEEVIAP